MNERPAESPQTPRRRRLLIVLIAVGVFAIVGIVGTLLSTIGKPTAGPQPPAPIAPLAGHDICADRLVVHVDTDEQMIQIAGTVHNDHRARKVYTETKQEAFQRYQQIFKDQPNLLRLARPQSLSASVTIVPADGVELRVWADQLRAALPAAKSVQPIIRAEVLSTMITRYATADVPPPCPSSGEWTGPTR